MNFYKTDCVLCKRYIAGKYFCRVCGESMCEDCKAIHNNGKATKDHEVVPVTRFFDLPKLEPKTCCVRVYRGIMHSLYCEDCDMPACIDCMIKGHSRHKFSKLPDATEKAKHELSTGLENMKRKIIPGIHKAIFSLEERKNKYDKQINEVKKKLQAEAKTLTEMTNIYSDIGKKLANQQHDDVNTLQNDKQILSDTLSKVTETIEIYKEKLDSEDDFELIKFIRTRQNPSSLMFIPRRADVQPPSYITGAMGKQPITIQVGKLTVAEEETDEVGLKQVH